MYEKQLADKKAQFYELSRKIKSCYAANEQWIDRYSGGMPAGFLAAIAYWESGCKMSSSGDLELGEVGMYQIADSAVRNFSVASSVRHSVKGNTFLAGLEYNAKALELQEDFPGLVLPGTADQWKLARLAFAIGYPGLKKLIEASAAAPGQVYTAVARLVNERAFPLGRQSAEKVWYRVHAVQLQWDLGYQVTPWAACATPRLPPKDFAYSVGTRLERAVLHMRVTSVAVLAVGLFLGKKFLLKG